MYKLVLSIDGKEHGSIHRLADDTFIPFAPDNTSYQQYLAWLAEGNEPLPAEQASPAEQPET